MEKIWERLIVRHREMVSYVFWGAVTTLVNYAVYFICTKLCSIHYLVSNIIAWVIAVIFAYVVNKVLVFGSKDWSKEKLFQEVWQFAAAREIGRASCRERVYREV